MMQSGLGKSNLVGGSKSSFADLLPPTKYDIINLITDAIRKLTSQTAGHGFKSHCRNV